MEEVKEVIPAASPEGVETAAPAPVQEVKSEDIDYLILLAEKDKEIEKIKEEKENYKQGLLIAKGKREDDGSYASPDEDADARTRRIFHEESLKRDEARIIKEKEAIITQLAKTNAELKTALGNRNQIGGTGQGGGSGGLEVQDSVFSKDTLMELKAKGIDITNKETLLKIKANLKKYPTVG